MCRELRGEEMKMEQWWEVAREDGWLLDVAEGERVLICWTFSCVCNMNFHTLPHGCIDAFPRNKTPVYKLYLYGTFCCNCFKSDCTLLWMYFTREHSTDFAATCKFSFLKAVTIKDRSHYLNLLRRAVRPVGAISLFYFGKGMYPRGSEPLAKMRSGLTRFVRSFFPSSFLVKPALHPDFAPLPPEPLCLQLVLHAVAFHRTFLQTLMCKTVLEHNDKHFA